MGFKDLFKYYPDKSKKPNVKSILIGFLYDFGWAYLIIISLIIYFHEQESANKLQSFSTSVYIVILFAVTFQLLFTEFFISWMYYFVKKRKIQNDVSLK